MLSTYTDDTRQICPINITCIVKKIGLREKKKHLTVGVSVRAHPISSPCKPSTYVTSTNVS